MMVQSEVLKADDWRKPYRTMDESGTPNSAGVVGWNWISEIAQQERARDAALLVVQDTPMQGDGKVIRLYRSTTLLAVATLFRDDMNFAVLVRWLSPELARTPAVATDEGVVDPDVLRRLKSVATTLETCGKHGIPIDFALLASDIRAAISTMAHRPVGEGK